MLSGDSLRKDDLPGCGQDGSLPPTDWRRRNTHPRLRLSSVGLFPTTKGRQNQPRTTGWLLVLPTCTACSGESTRPPPMWPGFNSRSRRHMWVEFVVGSLLAPRGFSPGTPVFPSPQKNQHSKFQ